MNGLESLETLILNYLCGDIRLPPNELFMKRLKRLFVPNDSWIKGIEHNDNIISFGSDWFPDFNQLSFCKLDTFSLGSNSGFKIQDLTFLKTDFFKQNYFKFLELSVIFLDELMDVS